MARHQDFLSNLKHFLPNYFRHIKLPLNSTFEQEEGLNKTAIGDYLGEKKDFNEAVLKVIKCVPTVFPKSCMLVFLNAFMKEEV